MISFIVPTIGRHSLIKTLASIETWPGDEILLVGDVDAVQFASGIDGIQDRPIRSVLCSRGNDWGHVERNLAAPHAMGKYLAHIDDDDVYAPGHRALMADAIGKTPGRPVLFRMRYPNGITLWNEPELRCGNVGTPMILIPNVPEKLGRFESFVGGDCAYLEQAQWDRSEFVWRPEVIALIGRNT